VESRKRARARDNKKQIKLCKKEARIGTLGWGGSSARIKRNRVDAHRGAPRSPARKSNGMVNSSIKVKSGVPPGMMRMSQRKKTGEKTKLRTGKRT